MLAAEPAFTRPKRPVDKLGDEIQGKAGSRRCFGIAVRLGEMVEPGNDQHLHHMVESRAQEKLEDSYYEETMKLIATQFGLTKPPELPTDDDRFTVAGIVDRYEPSATRAEEFGRAARSKDKNDHMVEGPR